MGVKSIRRKDLDVLQTPIHKIRTYLNTEVLETLSFAEITRENPYDWSESGNSHYFYYIVEGQGEFVLEDESQQLDVGDIFVVPPHKKYRTPVGVRMLAVVTPRFKTE